MDFKTRFQGKTSTISKDGGIETAISTTKVPINKVDVSTISYHQSTQENQLISYGGGGTSSHSNGFPSYNASTYSQQFQTIGPRGMSSGSTQNNNHALALYYGNGIGSTQNYPNSNSYDYTNNQYINSGYSPLRFNSSSSMANDLEELRADNIYLKGGSNMAEVLLSKQSESVDNSNRVGVSIAMRMKKNREAALQQKQEQYQMPGSDQQSQQFNPFAQGSSNKPANQDQYWASTAYSDHSHSSQANQMATPLSTSQSKRNAMQLPSDLPNQTQSSQPQVQTVISQSLASKVQAYSKPPSSKNLRNSVEKQRQTNFANVSKQIITASTTTNTINTNDNNVNGSGKAGETAVTVNANLKRQNSQINKLGAQQQQQQNIKQRAASVSTTPALNGQTSKVTDKSQPQKRFSSNNTQSNLNKPTNLKPTLDNPYQLPQNQQQQQLPFQNGTGLQNSQNQQTLQPAEQLQQQLLMMQHQMMLLQQQQQFIMGGPFSSQQPTPQLMPLLSQQLMNGVLKSVNGVGQTSPDIYQQFELADQKYQEQNKPPQSSTQQTSLSTKQQKQPTTTTTSSIYKPYSVKDYKQMQQTQQTLKLGGLGANIGSEEWEKAKKKLEQKQEYARQVKMQMASKPMGNNQRRKEEKPKDKTAREKALEFSKNVPRPKLRSPSLQQNNQGEQQQNTEPNNDYYEGENEGEYSQQSKYLSEDLNNVIEDGEEGGYDEYGNTLKGHDLASLQMRHEEYANEDQDGPKYILITENREKKHISREYAGKGTAYYPNGDIYEGDFQDGIREGRGKYFYASNGDKYDGEWKQNFKHGIGKMLYNGKGEYNGYWENGRRHGEGVFTYPNGDIYSGWWKFGDKEGTGTYIFKATGMKLFGAWKGAKIDSGRWIYPNGMYYEGAFENNKPSGKGKWVYKNGNQLTGFYEQKKKEEEDEQEEELEEGQEPKPKFSLIWHSDTNIAEAAHLVNSVEQ